VEEAFEEGQDSCRAIEPMMMMNQKYVNYLIMVMNYWLEKKAKPISKEQRNGTLCHSNV
jgi:hypothetical protein